MFYPNTLKKNQVHLLLYYYCLCKSFNELFHLLQDNFVPESGCKGIKKINNTQAFLRKISTKIATFFLFLQKEHKISKYTLFIYMGVDCPFKQRIQFCRSLPNYKKRRHQVRPHALSSSYLTLNVKVCKGATNTIPVYSSIFVRPLFGNMVVSVLTTFLLFMVCLVQLVFKVVFGWPNVKFSA